MIEKINETRSWLLEKVNKIDTSLVRLRKKGEESNKIKNERGDITTDITEIKRMIGDYCEQL